MTVKVSCPECKTITEYTGEVKKGKFITCSNPQCRFPSGKRRRIKVIPNVIPSVIPGDINTTSDTEYEPSQTYNQSRKRRSDTKVVSPVIPSDTSDTSDQIMNIKELKQKYDSLKHHELNEGNMISFFLKIKQAKLYELARFFDLSPAHEIDTILQVLRKKGILHHYKDGWHRINPNYRKAQGGNE